MGWLSGPDGSKDESLAARDRDWETALARGRLPGAVEERLRDARAGRTPWVATMTPAELLAARSHGVRPIATVSGTCWMGYGYSWTVSGVPAPPCGGEERLRVHVDGRGHAAWSYAGVKARG